MSFSVSEHSHGSCSDEHVNICSTGESSYCFFLDHIWLWGEFKTLIITCCLFLLLFLSGLHSLAFSLVLSFSHCMHLGKSFLRFFLSIKFSFLIVWSISLFEHIGMFVLQLVIFWVHFSIGEMDRLDSHGKIPVCPSLHQEKKSIMHMPNALFFLYYVPYLFHHSIPKILNYDHSPQPNSVLVSKTTGP